MATYAAYRHVELDRVGLGKRRVNHPPGGETQLNNEVGPENLTVRVLKPPGGGSSISFGEDEDARPRPKTLPQQQAPQENSPKADTNGTASPQCENDAAATKENNPLAATNGSATNGSPSVGSNSGRSSNCATTPTSAKKLDTQSRLFGDDPGNDTTPSRKVRDHQRSNIFSDEPVTKPSGSANGPRAVACNKIGLLALQCMPSVFCRTWTRRDPVTGVGVLCWDIHAPRCAPNKRKAINPAARDSQETKTPEQPQQKQRQRVPPGGFSTQLW
ncbi:microtubule-associated protein Jupiter isoform X4 [Cherax quadricarinatus]|uniref:microtubule-associated protein Jupiter isoform X4 n=1 Tax=Cherax quadricarinatus TaxID=27406 RepID=UPI0023789C1C|nr:microtubule-associated protein Jupiter-like isoform X4 [Cherax quadricarinatus]